MSRPKLARLLLGALAVLLAAGGWYAWQALRPEALPPGLASGNGRIEAVEIDLASKIPGRVAEILVEEGDFVTAGQVLARIDTAVLEALLREAQAQLQSALIGVETAQSELIQREAEIDAARAVVAQRQAERDAAAKQLARTEDLARKGTSTLQQLDEDRARHAGAQAAVSAAEAQVAAAQAARSSARSAIVAAGARTDAVRATLERIQVDIDDGALKAPREARVQYRVAEPSEVLPAGGVVLNLIDLTDVYMTFFLPTESAGRVAIGAEARIVLDAAPQFVFPARVSFVADEAQFTPRTVETAEEREKLMFRIKARVDPELLRRHLRQVKTGLPGVAYVRLDERQPWPAALEVRVP